MAAGAWWCRTGLGAGRIRASLFCVWLGLGVVAGPAAADGGLGRFFRGLARLGAKVLGASTGQARAGSTPGPYLGRSIPSHGGRPGLRSGATLAWVTGGVHRVLLEGPHGETFRIPVPGASDRRGSLLVVDLPPGEYAWTGFEIERSRQDTVQDGKVAITVRTTRIWQQRGEARWRFARPGDAPIYAGTLEVSNLEPLGDTGPLGIRDSTIVMPHGHLRGSLHAYDDFPMVAAWMEKTYGVTVENGLAGEGDPLTSARKRHEEAAAFATPLELEPYLRFLGRLVRFGLPASWPRLESGGEGALFRLGLYRSFQGWSASRTDRRRLRFEDWLEETGREDASRLLAAEDRRSRIREIFEARRKRAEAETTASATETAGELRKTPVSWGEREP